MYLYGAGGHAKVIMDILKENSTELTGIIDDNPHIQEWMEYHVLSYDPKRRGCVKMYVNMHFDALSSFL